MSRQLDDDRFTLLEVFVLALALALVLLGIFGWPA